MTALAFFSKPKSASVPVVCPACGSAFPVEVNVLRSAKTLGCPSCRHIRAAPALPGLLRAAEEEAPLSEFPRPS